MNNFKCEGFILITSVLIMTTLLVAGSYLIAISNSENRIATIQSMATKNYYLSEAGINEMLWKIQNDTATGDAFLDGTLDASHDINRSNVFGDPKASYVVAARNTVTAEAWIIATSTYQIGDNTSQRVVKSYISQATGDGTEWNFGTFAGGRGSQNGNFRFNGTGVIMTANGGRLHANQEFKVQGVELIVNDGAVTSANVINVVAGGQLTLNNSYQDVPTSTIDMLQIDFNSDDPNSWKNRATSIYSEDDFEDLPNNTTLDGIIYVTGDAEIDNKNLTINGVLVAEDDIEIEIDGSTLDINAHATYGGGILARGDLDIDLDGGTIEVDGLIYSSDFLDITNSGGTMVINGCLSGFDAEITRSAGTITLNFVPENFQAVIDSSVNPESPIIQIDHWEEQY